MAGGVRNRLEREIENSKRRDPEGLAVESEGGLIH
jgi:hypothetical protein